MFKTPITFAHERVQPDTRLTVFKQPFMVHSTILRVHSDFFRRFIDSADKANPTLSGPIKYEWVTEVDEYDHTDWALLGVTNDAARGRNINEEKFVGIEAIEEEKFNMLLAAIYSRPYRIDTISDLENLANLANYYRAQPVVSRTVVTSFSPTFGRCINKFAQDILPISIQFRNAVLFRECMTQLMGPWNQPRYLTIQDTQLRSLINEVAEKTHNKIATKIAEAHQRLLELSLSMPHRPLYPPGWGQGITQALFSAGHWSRVGNQLYMPLYFRQLSTYQGAGGDDIRRVLGQLLQSSLKLEYYQRVGAGEIGAHRDYRDYFLCSEIDDKDLPWDTKEVEW